MSGALSFLVSILSVVKNTLQFAEKTQVHFENYKDYRKLVSHIDEILSSETINLDLYSKIENSYNDILEKTPIFNDEFLNDFKKKNTEFIKAASKSGLIPDILLNFDSLIESDLFYQYNANNQRNDIIQDCKLKHAIPIPKISELKKLQITEPIVNKIVSTNIKQYPSINSYQTALLEKGLSPKRRGYGEPGFPISIQSNPVTDQRLSKDQIERITDVESCNEKTSVDDNEEEMKLLANTLTKYRTIANEYF